LLKKEIDFGFGAEIDSQVLLDGGSSRYVREVESVYDACDGDED
jgi:hypothetical protein